MIAQFLGSLIGALVIALAFPAAAKTAAGYGATDFGTTTSYLTAVALEAVGTFFLVFAIMGTAVDKRAPAAVAGLAIGLTLAGLILVLGTVTGTSLNPARTLGPVLIQLLFGGSYQISHLLVYFLGPIIGGITGAFTYDFLGKGGMSMAKDSVKYV